MMATEELVCKLKKTPRATTATRAATRPTAATPERPKRRFLKRSSAREYSSPLGEDISWSEEESFSARIRERISSLRWLGGSMGGGAASRAFVILSNALSSFWQPGQ